METDLKRSLTGMPVHELEMLKAQISPELSSPVDDRMSSAVVVDALAAYGLRSLVCQILEDGMDEVIEQNVRALRERKRGLWQ